MFFTGLLLFTVASLFCGLAQNSLQLIVARVVQGLAGGIFVPAVTALIQLLFPGPVRGKAFAIMGSVIGVSTALGPILGGLIIEAFGDENGWRLVFWVNLPIGVIALIAAAKILPAGAEGKAKDGYDFVGLVLLTAGLIALLVPLIEGQDKGWPAWTFITLAAGVLLIVAFAFWEKRIEDDNPMVPPHLFSHPAFTGGTILALVYFAAFTSIFFTISLLWQAGLGHTALESGVVGVPFAIGSIIGASQSNRLSQRLGSHGARRRHRDGRRRAWSRCGSILRFVPAADLVNWDLLLPLLVAGIGSGLFIAPNAQFIVATVNRSEAGAASGVISVMQRVGSAIGIAVIGSVLFGTLHITSKDPAQIAAGVRRRRRARHGGQRGAGHRQLRAGVRAAEAGRRARRSAAGGARDAATDVPARRRTSATGHVLATSPALHWTHGHHPGRHPPLLRRRPPRAGPRFDRLGRRPPDRGGRRASARTCAGSR